MIRLFVGIAIPPAYGELLARRCTGLVDARWIDPANMHVTLRFIGDIDEGAADDVDASLATIEAPAFDLRLSGFGSFGSERRMRAVWAGIEPSPVLVHLHDKVESAVVRAGFPPEGRKFSPHVTLARLKGTSPTQVRDFVETQDDLAATPFPVRHFTLFKSHLSHSGASYRPAAEYPLDEIGPVSA